MKVLQNSWHYRLWLFRHRKRSEHEIRWRSEELNLCKYFWTIVFMPLILAWPTFVWGFLSVFGFSYDKRSEDWEPTRPKQGIAVVFLIWLTGIYLPLFWFTGATEVISAVVLAASMVAAGVVLVVALAEFWKTQFREHPEAVSLVGEYRRAVKARVCPKIEVVEEAQ